MCGRFAFYSPAEAVSRLFAAETIADLPPRYNIAPTQPAPTVRLDQDSIRRLNLLRWGLVPFWAKDPSIGNRMINARAETVASKPAFRQAFRKRRCLILADGFYEWQKADSGKIPWFINAPSGEPFAMAGLWESWQADGDEPLETCTILTTEAGSSLARIHHRMPVVLGSEGVQQWLDPNMDEGQLPLLADEARRVPLEAIRVSRQVNNPENEGPDLLRAAENQASA
ncbi:MAG: SOS response-associated peptidase [Gammaproteobacteria bacterium]